MDFFHSHVRKQDLKHHKKRLSEDQIRHLETSFNLNNKLDPDRKSQLAQELGLPPRKVAIWYQNKRARWKNQNLEVNHKSLQGRLEGLMLDNERLKIEVESLKEELQKAQEMIVSISRTICCDEVGNSNLLIGGSTKNNDHHGFDKDLFACLIGTTNGQDLFSPSLS